MAALASKRNSQLTMVERARQEELQREAQAAAEEEAKDLASEKFADFVDSEEEVRVCFVLCIRSSRPHLLCSPYAHATGILAHSLTLTPIFLRSRRRLKRHRRLRVRTRSRLLFVHTRDPAVLLALPQWAQWSGFM